MKRIIMDFDDMLEEIGEMGKFQITTYVLVCIPVLFAAANSLSYVFTAGVPNYRCYVPECEDFNNATYDGSWLPYAIPEDPHGSYRDHFRPSQCDKYLYLKDYDNNTEATCSPQYFTKELVKCDKWVFGEERTIVNDWKITCLENQWMLSLVGTMHFAGIIVGSALFGILADRYGRKLMFVISIVIMSVSGAAQVMSPNYQTFAALIFVNSIGTAGVYPLAFIIGVELVGRKKREMTGIVLNYFYAIGEALVALLAWLLKDWRYIQFIVSAPCILFAVYYWLVPESVRWLLVKKKSKRAKGIVCKAAKMNGVVLSSTLLSTFEDYEEEPLNESPEDRNNTVAMLSVLFKSKKLVTRFIIVLFIWAVNAFVYYGLSLISTSISGDKYVNFALVCLVEIPGYTLAWISIQYLGRRPSLIGSLFLCGITCVCSVFVPTNMTWAIVTLFLVGKLGITSSFSIMYVHTSELLPTAVRSGGVGTASTTARFGALLAPFVPLLGVYVQPLPMILFGGVSILAGLLSLKLPETLGTKLPESIEEAEKL